MTRDGLFSGSSESYMPTSKTNGKGTVHLSADECPKATSSFKKGDLAAIGTCRESGQPHQASTISITFQFPVAIRCFSRSWVILDSNVRQIPRKFHSKCARGLHLVAKSYAAVSLTHVAVRSKVPSGCRVLRLETVRS